MQAKDTSHIGMIVGAVCLFGLFIAVVFKIFTDPSFDITIQKVVALIIMGSAPALPFCPIYVSTWIDKIIELKEKGLVK